MKEHPTEIIHLELVSKNNSEYMLIAIPNAHDKVDYHSLIQNNRWVQLRNYTKREELHNLTANYVRDHSCNQFNEEKRFIAPGIADQIKSKPDRFFGTLYAVSFRYTLDSHNLHRTTALAEDDFDLERIFEKERGILNLKKEPFHRFMHPHTRLCRYMALIGGEEK